MTNPDFKKSSFASSAALMLALLFLISVCVIPQMCITHTYRIIEIELKKAFNAVYAVDYEEASLRSANIRDHIVSKAGILEVFFDHTVVYELLSAAESAASIAVFEDPAQLIDELSEIAVSLDYLYRVHKLSFWNIA